MAGGQQINVGQGSVSPSDDVAASGSFATFSDGVVTYSVGDTETALAGSSSTAGQQSISSAVTQVLLRSRKVGAGSSSRLLSGLQFGSAIGGLAQGIALAPTGLSASGAQGGFTRQVARLLSGQPSTVASGNVSIAVRWTAQLSYTISSGQDVTHTLPVTASGGAFIDVQWVGPGGQPAWVVLTDGTSPTIRFTGAQNDNDDLTGVVLSATANGQTQNSNVSWPSGSITVNATGPSWTNSNNTQISLIASPSNTYDLTDHISGWTQGDHVFQRYDGGAALSTIGVTLNADTGILTWDEGTASEITNVQFELVPSADADWAARSAGAVHATNFETLALYNLGQTSGSGPGYYNGDYGQRGFRDTTGPRCSGTGSLRLERRSGENSANACGSYTNQNSGLFSGFGQNSEFFIQFRYRVDSNWNQNETGAWGGVGAKVIIIHQNNWSRSDIEIAMQRYYTTNRPRNYVYTRDCNTVLTAPTATVNTPYLHQQRWNIDAGGPPWTEEAGYKWEYNSSTAQSFVFLADTWYTIDYRIRVGTWGQANSTIECWITPAGTSTRQKLTAWIGRIDQNFAPSDVFNNLTLTGYYSNGTSNSVNTAKCWYDELIVSSSSIALPAAPPLVG